MENLKTLIGLICVLTGLGLFYFKATYPSAPLLGVALLVLGVVILFTKRELETKDLGHGWHGGNDEIRNDD